MTGSTRLLCASRAGAVVVEDASTAYVGENSVVVFNNLITANGVPLTDLHEIFLLRAEDILVDELVAELALGVVPVDEGLIGG